MKKFKMCASFLSTNAPRVGFSDIATLEDVRYCYRLLLQREPSQEEREYWIQRLDKETTHLQGLMEHFLNSSEVRARQRVMRQPLLVELESFKIYVRRDDWVVGAQIIRDKIYEPHVTREMRPLLRSGAVMVDIGANIGYFSLLAASLMGPSGKVIAFEPLFDNCELINLSIRANNLGNIVVYPYAVAETEQMLAFIIEGSDGTMAELSAGQFVPPHDQLAHAVTLDKMLRDEPKIDLVKMDTEGTEARVLKGMLNIIRHHRPVIFTELHPALLKAKSDVTPERYLNDIRELGYELFSLPIDGRKSEVPQSNEQIMDCLRRYDEMYRRIWLELVAYPR
jgi:FkbM family methyltransferase